MKPDFIDPKEAFRQAVSIGILSSKESDEDFTGRFIYMYTEKGVHYFKNKSTGKYAHNRKTVLEALARAS